MHPADMFMVFVFYQGKSKVCYTSVMNVGTSLSKAGSRQFYISVSSVSLPVFVRSHLVVPHFLLDEP